MDATAALAVYEQAVDALLAFLGEGA